MRYRLHQLQSFNYKKILLLLAIAVCLVTLYGSIAIAAVFDFAAVDQPTAQSQVNVGCAAVTPKDTIIAYGQVYVPGGYAGTSTTPTTRVSLGSYFKFCSENTSPIAQQITKADITFTVLGIQPDITYFSNCVSGASIAPGTTAGGGLVNRAVVSQFQVGNLSVSNLKPGRNCFSFYYKIDMTPVYGDERRGIARKDAFTNAGIQNVSHFYIEYTAAPPCPNGQPDIGFGCCPPSSPPAFRGKPRTDTGDTCGGVVPTPPPVVGGSGKPHKFMLGTFVKPLLGYVRDNFTIPFDLFTYIWADVGQRLGVCSSSIICSSGHFWTNGRWAPSELGTDDRRAPKWDQNPNDPAFPYDVAQESLCYDKIFHPATLFRAAYWDQECQDHLPMAYEASPAYGGGTNDGNVWIHALKHTVPFFFGWDPFVGGIVSPLSESDARFANLDTTAAAGKYATHVNQVQVSGTHAAASGITAAGGTQVQAWQGLVRPNSLQLDFANSLNLPAGSQGPQTSTWDNIKNPTRGGFSESINAALLAFYDFTGEQSINPAVDVDPKAIQFGSVTATSLLQDGNGNGYSQPTEPLTYTASITGADNLSLRWKEYADWEQIDNKGHYYTDKAPQATGAYKGLSKNTTAPYYPNARVTNPGTQGPDIITMECLVGLVPELDINGDPTGRLICPQPLIQVRKPDVQNTVSVSTGFTCDFDDLIYYDPAVESKFGWINPPGLAAGPRFAPPGSAPYAVVGSSYFNSDVRVNPLWASIYGDIAGQPWWQPDNLPAPYAAYSSRNATGATQGPAAVHNGSWLFDQTDPAYTNRSLFNVQRNTGQFWVNCSPTPPVTFSYWNNGSFDYGAAENSTLEYYPDRTLLFEDSGYPGPGQTWGLYDDSGHSATKDGTTDGLVDASWQWVDNYRRVHYEVTKDHIRDFGPRKLADPTLGVDCAASDAYFMGTDLSSCAAPGRGIATIINPTIEANAGGTATGDIYSGGDIDSYFQTSSAGSAFLFTPSTGITAFNNFATAGGYLGGYVFNPDRSRVNITFCDPTCSDDPINHVFQDPTVATMKLTATLMGANISGPINLDIGTNIKQHVYDAAVGLTINGGTCFTGSAGTIIVTGDLHITGDFGYCPSGPITDRSKIPSVGFIVSGDIIIDKNVQNIVGSYFAKGQFVTLSVVDSGNLTSGDVPFTLSGLVIAGSFKLDRQIDPDPTTGAKPKEETFNYDGRVVVAAPPGFTNLYSTKAVWNESVPYN